jgi:hypothetical protein
MATCSWVSDMQHECWQMSHITFTTAISLQTALQLWLDGDG